MAATAMVLAARVPSAYARSRFEVRWSQWRLKVLATEMLGVLLQEMPKGSLPTAMVLAARVPSAYAPVEADARVRDRVVGHGRHRDVGAVEGDPKGQLPRRWSGDYGRTGGRCSTDQPSS